MCGIIGYMGYRKVASVLLKGLKHLEYRGYDPAGILSILVYAFRGYDQISLGIWQVHEGWNDEY